MPGYGDYESYGSGATGHPRAQRFMRQMRQRRQGGGGGGGQFPGGGRFQGGNTPGIPWWGEVHGRPDRGLPGTYQYNQHQLQQAQQGAQTATATAAQFAARFAGTEEGSEGLVQNQTEGTILGAAAGGVAAWFLASAALPWILGGALAGYCLSKKKEGAAAAPAAPVIDRRYVRAAERIERMVEQAEAEGVGAWFPAGTTERPGIRDPGAAGVGAFWDSPEVREANKERRRVASFQRKHRNALKALARLSDAEEDLEAVGIDPDEVYAALDLPYLGIVGQVTGDYDTSYPSGPADYSDYEFAAGR